MTAREIVTAPEFLEACRVAGVEPTVRQARKFIKAEGEAYSVTGNHKSVRKFFLRIKQLREEAIRPVFEPVTD